MNKNTNSFIRGILPNLSVLLLFAIISISSAFADNKLRIDNFSINPGGQKVVPVILENSDPMTSFQFDITLPEGLSCQGYKTNQNRLDRDQHSVQLTQLSGTKWRVVILTVNDANIMGNSGDLLYLTIKATDYKTKGNIVLDRIFGTNVNAGKFNVPTFTAEVSPHIGSLVVANKAFSMKPDSSLTKIDVELNNDTTIYGMQLDVALPKGLSIETKSNGYYKFEYGDRIPQDATITAGKQADGKVRILIAALSHNMFNGRSGSVFSFYVKGDKDLSDTSKITFSNVVVSGPNDVAYDIDEVPTVVITNYYGTEYAPVLAQIDTIAKLFTDTIARINTDFAGIKEQKAIVDAETEISKSIEAVRGSLLTSYNKNSVATDKANILAACENVKVSIGKLFTDARMASDLFDSTSVASQIDTVAQVYAKALDKVSADYPNIKAQEAIVKAEAAIAKNIVDLRDSVSVSYKNGTIAVDKEKILTACDDAKAVVAKFVEDARKAFVKLKIQYGLVTSQIDAVEKSYNAAVEKINTEYASIKDRDVIINAESKIAKELLNMRDSAKTAYDKGIVEEKKAGIQDSCDVTKADIAALLNIAATVGISNVSADDEVIVGIYTVSGIKVSTPVKGQVNIFKYKDGKVKSVYVK